MAENNIFNLPPVYFKADEFIQNKQLYLSPETLQAYGLGSRENKVFINYFKVDDFNSIDEENFIFETRLKNSLYEGGMVCQVVQVSILFENGLISIPFCHPGCVSNVHLHIGEVFKDGKQSDLSAFGFDLSKWNTVKIELKNKKVDIYVDGKAVYKLSFQDALGKVAGFHYRFDGSGAIDHLKVYSNQNELVYSDGF